MAFGIAYENTARARLHESAAQFHSSFLSQVQTWIESLANKAEEQDDSLTNFQPEVLTNILPTTASDRALKTYHNAGIRTATRVFPLPLLDPDHSPIRGEVSVLFQIRQHHQQIYIIAFLDLPWLRVDQHP